jgi:toxin ParE1/3/4
MALLRISADAHADLDEIWFRIAADNIEAADRLTDGILGEYSQLARDPFLGRLRPELRADIRSWAHGNYVIFYAGTTNAVQIIPVLHGARDLPSSFK